MIGKTNAIKRVTGDADPYKGQRPSNWLAIKLPSQMKVDKPNNFQCEILTEITQGGYNKVWLKYSGEFTIDWGDGTVENVSDITKTLGYPTFVSHTYTYSTLTNALTDNSKQVVIKIVNTSFNTYSSWPPEFYLDGYYGGFDGTYRYADVANMNEYYTTPFLEISAYTPKVDNKWVNFYVNSVADYFNDTKNKKAYFKKLKFLSLDAFGKTNNNILVTPNFVNFIKLYSLVLLPEWVNAKISALFNEGSAPDYFWDLRDAFAGMHSFSGDIDSIFGTEHLSEVSAFNYTFKDSQALSKLPTLMTFGEAKSIKYAFDGCIGISDFHTSTFTNKLVAMDYAFRGSGIEVCDDLDTSNVTSMIEAFKDCASLRKLTLNLNSINKEESIKDFVKGCGSLTSLTISKSGGIDIPIDLSDCVLLPATELVALFRNLKKMTLTTPLVLGDTLINKLTSEQKAIATGKNWTLV